MREKREVLIDAYLSRYLLHSNLASTWLLEAVKHLALIDLAGIAGAAAFAAREDTNYNFLVIAVVCFGISSLQCVIAMGIGYSRFKHSLTQDRAHLVRLASEKEVEPGSIFDNFIKRWLPAISTGAGIMYGSISLAFTAMGLGFLLFALRT